MLGLCLGLTCGPALVEILGEQMGLSHEAAQQVDRPDLLLPGQARGGQRRKAPLDPRDLVRARRRPVQGDVGDPWPAAVELPELERPVAQAGAPSGGSRGGGGLARRVHHQLEQVLLRPDVAVERHGRHPQLLGDARQGGRFQAGGVSQLDRRVDHRVDIQRRLAPQAGRPLRQSPLAADQVRHSVFVHAPDPVAARPEAFGHSHPTGGAHPDPHFVYLI